MKKHGMNKCVRALLMTVLSVAAVFTTALSASAAGLSVATGDTGISPVWFIVFGLAAALIIAVVVVMIIKRKKQ